MFDLITNETQHYDQLVQIGAQQRLTDQEFILKEIRRFKASKRRKRMLDGERYYEGKQDILRRKRTAIGEEGRLEEVENLPNNRIVDNQYRKMVDQKKNYLLGQPVVFRSDNETYGAALQALFNKAFHKLMKNIGEDSLNFGIGWLFVNYNSQGELEFKRMKASEVIPGWADLDHTQLDYVIRFYEMICYEGKEEKVYEKVEIYEPAGVYRLVLKEGRLVPDDEPFTPYLSYMDQEHAGLPYNWSRIPFIAFKYNSREIPLIIKVKTLQDSLNSVLSNFQNNIEEDARNTLLVLVNYDGEKLDEFRRNLTAYGAVKVRNDGSGGGDVRTLKVEVDSENYRAILELLKKAIIENAMGYDAKDDRLGGNANELNILSMYSDIDLDANDMETEYQAAFQQLLWFVNAYFQQSGIGDFQGEEAEVLFNRDILISETEAIENCRKSIGILSYETITGNHPWVDDLPKELERLKKQEQDAFGNMGQYQGTFGQSKDKGGGMNEPKE